MSGPETHEPKREATDADLTTSALVDHATRLLRDGQTLDAECEVCRQVAVELCVDFPRPSSS